MQYDYDLRDNLTQITDPRGVVTQYQYNAFDELTQQISPDSGTVDYLYDAAGNLAQRSDAKGVIPQYQYDALNRLTQVTYPANSALNITLTYDQAHLIADDNYNASTGRLTQLQDPAGTTRWRYGGGASSSGRIPMGRPTLGISLTLIGTG